ncbi:MAG: hypothetical protein AABW89_01210 [Nanoarchaeota archaeon]
MAKDDFWDELAKIGLVLGSVWLGARFLETFTDKDKNKDKGAGGNVNV